MSAPRTYRVGFQEVTCYALQVQAASEFDAIGLAAERFESLTPAERSAAVICATSLDWFEAEEVPL